jgi:type II secretory pathway pseudopilin PulG
VRKNTKISRAFSLVEVLGATAVVVTLASVAVVSVKDSLLAGQRSAVQRELQTLNSAWNSFKSAGGVIVPGSTAEDAVRDMRKGVKVSDTEDYLPLTEDPDLLKEIGGETYRLNYDDETGFSYTPDGGGAEFADAGSEKQNQGFGGYDFDPQNRAAAMAVLESLATLDVGDPNTDSLLSSLNAAYLLGTLTEADMTGVGLINYDGTWITPQQAQQNYAQDALNALSAGGSWSTLNAKQQRAYANVYPEAAVQVGKSGALNLIDPALLTPELVEGYVLTPARPTVWGSLGPIVTEQSWRPVSASSSTTTSVGNPYNSSPGVKAHLTTVLGPGEAAWYYYDVYAVSEDPLQPAVHLGTVGNSYTMSFNGFPITSYSFNPTDWNLAGITYYNSVPGSLNTGSPAEIVSLVPGTKEIVFHDVRQD